MAEQGTSINVWFTADPHFTHHSSLYFHPWRREAAGITMEELKEDKKKAAEKFDLWLIDKWNDTVKRKDYIYIIGDFCLGNKERTEWILSRLHGKKFLIRGNHDKSCNGLERYFEWTGDIKEAKFSNNQYKFIDPSETFCVEMCHYPMLSWNRRPHGTCHVHGHCHNSITAFNDMSHELRVDVGLDSDIAKGGLVSLEELYDHMRGILKTTGSSTFTEHVEKLMVKQGFRA